MEGDRSHYELDVLALVVDHPVLPHVTFLFSIPVVSMVAPTPFLYTSA